MKLQLTNSEGEEVIKYLETGNFPLRLETRTSINTFKTKARKFTVVVVTNASKANVAF